MKLKSCTSLCKFDDGFDTAVSKAHVLEEALIDRFICGVESETLQQVLLNKDPEKFSKCEEIALNYEMSIMESRSIKPQSFNHAIKSHPRKSQPGSSQDRYSKKYMQPQKSSGEMKAGKKMCGRCGESNH